MQGSLHRLGFHIRDKKEPLKVPTRPCFLRVCMMRYFSSMTPFDVSFNRLLGSKTTLFNNLKRFRISKDRQIQEATTHECFVLALWGTLVGAHPEIRGTPIRKWAILSPKVFVNKSQ